MDLEDVALVGSVRESIRSHSFTNITVKPRELEDCVEARGSRDGHGRGERLPAGLYYVIQNIQQNKPYCIHHDSLTGTCTVVSIVLSWSTLATPIRFHMGCFIGRWCLKARLRSFQISYYRPIESQADACRGIDPPLQFPLLMLYSMNSLKRWCIATLNGIDIEAMFWDSQP